MKVLCSCGRMCRSAISSTDARLLQPGRREVGPQRADLDRRAPRRRRRRAARRSAPAAPGWPRGRGRTAGTASRPARAWAGSSAGRGAAPGCPRRGCAAAPAASGRAGTTRWTGRGRAPARTGARCGWPRPARSAASSTTTSSPARASRIAETRPLCPAPMITTSACGGDGGSWRASVARPIAPGDLSVSYCESRPESRCCGSAGCDREDVGGTAARADCQRPSRGVGGRWAACATSFCSARPAPSALRPSTSSGATRNGSGWSRSAPAAATSSCSPPRRSSWASTWSAWPARRSCRICSSPSTPWRRSAATPPATSGSRGSWPARTR